MCPVKTFELYISKLHPSSDLFFQLPRRCYNVSDDLWFEPKPIGENTLGNFMPRISAMCSLSRRYTNHCLRSTAIALLDEAQFPSRHIMTVSGHKSENSIKSCNHHTNEETKRLMSHTLTRSLGIDTDSAIVETAAASQPVSVSAPRSPLMAITSSQEQHLFDSLAEADIPDEILAGIPLTEAVTPAPSSQNIYQQTMQSHIPCGPQIHANTVNIHYHFHQK